MTAEGKSAKEVQKILTSQVKPAQDKIQIRNMRTTDKVVIVETNSIADIEKLKTHEKLKESNVRIELQRKKQPLMIMYDVDAHLKEDEILDSIYYQNLEDHLSWEDFSQNFRLRFKTGRRDRATVHHVAEVSAMLRKILINKSRLYINFSAHSIKDYIVVAKCVNCQDLGHVAKHCKRERQVCAHCAQEGHKKMECGQSSSPAVCIPCKLRNTNCSPNKGEVNKPE